MKHKHWTAIATKEKGPVKGRKQKENRQGKLLWTSSPSSTSKWPSELPEPPPCLTPAPASQELLTFSFPRHDGAATAHPLPTPPDLSGDGSRAGDEHQKQVKHPSFSYNRLHFFPHILPSDTRRDLLVCLLQHQSSINFSHKLNIHLGKVCSSCWCLWEMKRGFGDESRDNFVYTFLNRWNNSWKKKKKKA